MAIHHDGYGEIEKNAILIPTPGQTEQEYLAKYLLEKKYFYSEDAREIFNLKNCSEKCGRI